MVLEMLKDITIGQFLPGNSVVHRLDPRTKIALVFAFIIMIFMLNNIVAYIPVALLLFAVTATAKIPLKMILKSLKPLLFFIIITAVINLFLTDGRVVFRLGFLKITHEGIIMTVQMALRLVFLVAGTSILTYTTSPIVLTDGIESILKPLKVIKVPSHEIAMMMTIALRFIPIIIDETDKITKAQAARGADFESGNILQRAKALVPILVPLFISAFRRADDLAIAMECRCYRGGENRTKLKQLKMSSADFGAFAVTATVFAVIFIVNFKLHIGV